MFTGLVETVGEILSRERQAGGVTLRIGSPLGRELSGGESLAVNGVCLTVARLDGEQIEANVGPETLRVTTLGDLAPGSRVNLERPLRADGRFGGHFVQGHTDAVGRIEQLRPDVDFCWLTVSFPAELSPFIVQKGSIAVDGISLTVASLAVDRFEVQLVPYTLEHTNLKAAQAGDRVNLECDIVGKYVARACQFLGFEAHVRA
jgi:riboflavin synthase